MTPPQFSVATKLYGIFALLATVTIILAVAAVINSRQHVALVEELGSASTSALNVQRVDGLIYAIVMESRGIYMSPEPGTAKVYADGLTAFNAQLSQVVSDWRGAVRAEDAMLFEPFAARIAQFQEFRRELVRRGIEVGAAAARDWGDNDANRNVRKALNDDIGALGSLYARRATSLYQRMENEIARTAWISGLLAASAVVLAAVGAIILWRSVVRPLARITRVADAVASGRADVPVPYGERGDEVGIVARSITVFQDTMRRNETLNRLVEDDAHGRSRLQARMSQEVGTFSAGMEATLGDLVRISDRMLAASSDLSRTAGDASDRTTSAAATSGDASADVREIASAAEELAASVSEIDRQVTLSNTIAMNAIAEAERTHATVKELNAAAGRIGDVVRLITDIAEQTNLLALNATIEAARAGDAGRGFAVVAAEVKALSGQTGRATEDIAAQIAAMQSATTRSIQAIGAIERTIRDIGGISSAIAVAVTQQGAATQEIARSVETAARRTVETSDDVERVGEATAATCDNAGKVRQVADDLGSVAPRLREQVERFFRDLRAA